MDDLTRKRPEDPDRININQQWEVRYWCNKLGCSEKHLRDVVKIVGPMVDDVKELLG